MNCIFISPQFPKTYWNFCDRLKNNGNNVLGIGDTPYDALDDNVKRSLTEYYYLPNMLDYDSMYRAVAFFASKYGRIHCIESNNEFWLENDARLRTDFNVCSGIKTDAIESFKSKAAMKKYYAMADVPTARCHRVTTREACKAFLEEVGYPVIVKPDNGVGASDTWKIENEAELDAFFDKDIHVPYVCEEFITGNIVSYDAILDSSCNPLFESMTAWPPSIADIVNKDLDLSYYVCASVPEELRQLGRRTVKAFNAFSRFVHLEFFCLTQPRKNLGEVGDYVGLEVNMRPAGGYTPDMMNFSHSTDVYQIWADMITFNENHKVPGGKDYFCVYAGRKDSKTYVYSHEEVLAKYGPNIVMCEEMPPMNYATMGRQMYTAKFETEEEAKAFIGYVQNYAV